MVARCSATAAIVHKFTPQIKWRKSALARPPERAALATALADWYRSPLGESLYRIERDLCEEQLPILGGYRAMQLSVTENIPLLDAASQLHKFVIGAVPGDGGYATISDYEALPLPSGVVDVAVLHHTLDYCAYPHETLNEVARVVSDSGHIVVLGFNPLSWIGLGKWPALLLTHNPMWQYRCLRAGRVVDWLRLLGFRCETLLRGGFVPPLQARSVLARLDKVERLGKSLGLPFGTLYMIVARKQVLKPISRPSTAWLPGRVMPLGLQKRSACQSTDKNEVTIEES